MKWNKLLCRAYVPVWTTDPITDGGGEGDGTPGGVVSGILPAIGGNPIASTGLLNRYNVTKHYFYGIKNFHYKYR